MGKYLKMADVFSMGVVQEDSFLISKGGEDLACFICYLDSDRDLMAKHASHAINSHDELVAEVGRLRGENDALMKCRMAAREFFNCTVASGDSVKVSSANKAALDDADKASDWLEIELKATADLVKK